MDCGVIYKKISHYQRVNKFIVRDMAIFYTIPGVKIRTNTWSEKYHESSVKTNSLSWLPCSFQMVGIGLEVWKFSCF